MLRRTSKEVWDMSLGAWEWWWQDPGKEDLHRGKRIATGRPLLLWLSSFSRGKGFL